LQRERRAHHLAVHGADGLRGEAPGARGEAVEHLTLALGVEPREVRVTLRARHVGHDARPLVEQPQDLVVEVVDALAMVVQPHDATLAWHLSRNLCCPGPMRRREKPTSRRDDETTSRRDDETTSRRDDETTSRRDDETTRRRDKRASELAS